MGLLIILGVIFLVGAIVATYFAFDSCDDKGKIIPIVIAVLCAVALIVTIFVGINGTENGKRWKKDLNSEFNGGLQRTITCYNQYGDVLRVYEGKMDIQTNEGNKIVFVMDNQKYMVYKGDFDTVIVEEHNQDEEETE